MNGPNLTSFNVRLYYVHMQFQIHHLILWTPNWTQLSKCWQCCCCYFILSLSSTPHCASNQLQIWAQTHPSPSELLVSSLLSTSSWKWPTHLSMRGSPLMDLSTVLTKVEEVHLAGCGAWRVLSKIGTVTMREENVFSGWDRWKDTMKLHTTMPWRVCQACQGWNV